MAHKSSQAWTFLQRKGTLLQIRRAATDITELYAPQFEQFGLELTGKGAVFTGEVATIGRTDATHRPLPCLHRHGALHYPDARYVPGRIHTEPYACVSEVSAPTLMCMPEAGITPANLKPLHGPWPNSAVCSFIQDSCGEELSAVCRAALSLALGALFARVF